LFTVWPPRAAAERPNAMTESFFSLTRDPRLSPYATSAVAAWLWAADGSRVLWANASGAALLGASNPLALIEKSFVGQELGAQIARLAAALPAAGAAQTHDLTGATGDAALACKCLRIRVGDTPAVLIVANAPVPPVLPLAERVERQFGASGAGSAPFAVFSGMGALLFASAQAADKLGSATTLAALGAGALMAQTIASGEARGDSMIGPLAIERMGSGGATVLVATLDAGITLESAANTPEITLEQSASEPETENFAEPLAATLADIGAALLAPPEPPAPTTTPAGEPEDAVEESREPIAETPTPPERRAYPLRFVWTMDAEQRFTLASRDFAEVAGPRTAALLGKPWGEIAAALALDPEGRVARAIASHDTWSGITLHWPVEGDERIGVELSGLPIFDRDRSFRGYRGFGVCRDAARLAEPVARDAEPPATEPEAPPASPADPRPVLTVVPAAKNVVPFRAATPEKRPALTPVERSAFREIAETLGSAAPEPEPPPNEPDPASAEPPRAEPEPPLPSAFATGADTAPAQTAAESEARAVLERLPVAILIHRGGLLIYANRAFLEWTGYSDLTALADAGGLERLVVEPGGPLDRINGTGKTFTIATRGGDTLTCEGRLYTVPWNGESALMLVLVRTAADGRLKTSEVALRAAEAETRELKSILDTATDGVIVTDRDGRVLALNRSAEALFGYDYHEIARRPFTELFAPESERAARDYLDGLISSGVASVLNDGREVIGRVRQGGLIPLFMTMGRIGEGEKLCAVFRDITQWKRAEEDLLNAKRTAERASSAKSDFLAKISHEIRTPLNAIIGFSEVMMEERFGAVGNERYREYLKDIHASGGHLVSLINDLLDLSKIEAGKLDLVFASVNLNQLVQQCVALMQPQANQQRIIIRSSLSPTLPAVVADARSVRQIVLNLLSNSIKFTGAGGQVIISTALTERAEIVMRVRDTGVGMTEKEIETAMEPFRQLSTSTRWGSGGTGLGLPLTKALAEANRAAFSIKSARDAGTLVEITFPGTRVLAE
jgi:PAS domain S-box-containing protein